MKTYNTTNSKKKIETHQQNSTTRLYAAIPTFDDWPSDFASPYHRYNFPCHLVQCFFFKMHIQV